MNDVFQRMSSYRVLPVASLKDAGQAEPLAAALCQAGLPCVEVTFRTEAAAEAISRISRALPDVLVGAGTVLSLAQADAAMSSGAEFIVSPGLNKEVVRYCQSRRVTVIPGVLTPTEIEAAMELGLEVLKFFPAEAFGGVNTLKALSAPYKGISFIPTGGISPQNLDQYLALDCVLACGGSWLADSRLLEAGDYEAIGRRAAEVGAA